eukprot:2483179-Karenia_brevis.AAC.1
MSVTGRCGQHAIYRWQQSQNVLPDISSGKVMAVSPNQKIKFMQCQHDAHVLCKLVKKIAHIRFALGTSKE